MFAFMHTGRKRRDSGFRLTSCPSYRTAQAGTIMTIRRAMLLFNGLILAAVIFTGFEISVFISNINTLQDVEQKRLVSLMLGEEVRKSSENLTANVRLYAVTGDRKAIDAYNDIVDTRAGVKPRPADALIAPGRKRELVDLLRDYGVTDEELALVARANQLSNALVILETEAMNAVEGKFKDASGNYTVQGAPDREKAALLVFGPAYQNATAEIMKPLDQFTRRLNERCSAEVKATRERVRTNSIYVSVCIGIIFIAVAASLLFANRAIATPLEETTKFAEYAAQGNLDASIAVSSSNEIGRLRKTLNFMIERLRFRIRESEEKQAHAEKQSREAQAARLRADEALGKANEAARQMHEAAERLADVARASEEVGRDLTARIEHSNAGAQEQAQRVAEATSAMEQMNLAVTDIAGNAAASSRGAQETRNAATAGVAVVDQVMESIQKVQDDSMELKSVMTALDRHAQDITRIMNVISDIADQTNLLALNAAIEAARAGEAGRGFAVVADEVRKLAEKTMASTSDVSSAITSIQESSAQSITQVERSVENINKTKELGSRAKATLSEILNMAAESADKIQAIAAASEEQSATSEGINRTVGQINVIATETASNMGDASRTVAELERQINVLTNLIASLNKQ
ncbi:MAG: hypothetical protein DBY37_09400 [Desulfovibrionaceae bacterium]|nr:MAG: hypothetical protein DBY37_09400 [Desulfovibrionaceae bacterium]